MAFEGFYWSNIILWRIIFAISFGTSFVFFLSFFVFQRGYADVDFRQIWIVDEVAHQLCDQLMR